MTEFLGKGLDEARKDDKSYRIVVFIDDLDRCTPDRALEVLESMKSFFDIEGIVYVIGMDSDTINSLVRKKYGEESDIKGLDYLQKIVQLPFQIPTWIEQDITRFISHIISEDLQGSDLVEEFENNKGLIKKGVELNPRQVKTFINTIILAKSVFDKPIKESIVVQALKFRREWNTFLELVKDDDKRVEILRHYKELKKEEVRYLMEKRLRSSINNPKSIHHLKKY